MLAVSVAAWGYSPVVAADGDAAWRVMREPDAPRAAIMDWMMPGLCGLELIRRVRERSPHGETFILMLTARGSGDDIVAGLEGGADDYLVKPFDRTELQVRLRAGLRGRSAGASADGSDAHPLRSGDVVGRYRLGSRLGEGGMGIVYAAEHVDLGLEVALKIMSPDAVRDEKARARFAYEARAASLVRSDYVARVHDYGVTARGERYIVMDRLHGETLEEAVERGPLPPAEALRVVQQAARGLDAAHRRGVLHRDVKPGNIFLSRDPELPSGSPPTVKMVDFGVAKVVEPRRPKITAQNDVIGTLEYMSPEQLTGGDVGPSADLWSLGACAYEAMTGVSPFAGRSQGDVVYRICVGPRPEAAEAHPAVPPAFQAWFERACAIEPAQRFATVDDFVGALAVAVESPPRRVGRMWCR